LQRESSISFAEVGGADPEAPRRTFHVMTIDVVRASPSTLRHVFGQVRRAAEQPTDRVILIALFTSLFFLHYVMQLFDLTAGERLIFATSRTLGGAQIIGFVAIAVVLKDLKSDVVLRWFDLATIFAVAIATIHPWRSIGALAVTALGVLFICRSDKRLRSLGQLCLGLAWIDLWGPIVMGLINQWLLPIETTLAQFPLSFFGSFSLAGNVILGPNGHNILVLEPCSAFRNSVAMAFIWLSLVKILRLDFSLWNVAILGVGLAVVVFLNTARIGVMAISYDQYVFWHLGPGLTIVKITMLTLVLGIFYFGLRGKPVEAA